MTNKLASLTVAELAQRIRSRRVSPVEVTEAVLARIEALNPRLNLFISTTADSARQGAATAAAEIAHDRYRGPLHGIPVGLKDLYDVAGVRCTFGSRIWRDRVPAKDATVVRRLKQAGAVLVGKHNLDEFAYGATNENPHYGAARNPWNPERVCGGSSGGTAGAVAAGLSVAGLGSDTGGSIRVPAALCGVVGLKPTYGRVSRAGLLPASWSLDHGGPITRSVADCAIVLQAIAGFDPDDPSTADLPVPDFSRELDAGVMGMRLGVPANFVFEAIESSVVETVRAAMKHFETLGAKLVDVSLPNVPFAAAATQAISSAERCAWHAPWLRERPSDYGPETLSRMRVGLLVSAVEYINAQKVRTLIQHDFADVFRRVDALLAPTCPMIAPRIGETSIACGTAQLVPRRVLARLSQPANLAGVPAISLPCGFVDGLPVGLQIIAPAWAEATVLRVARAYERETEWHRRVPRLDDEP